MIFTIIITLAIAITLSFVLQKTLKKNNAAKRKILKELEDKVRKIEESENKLNSIMEHMNEAVVAIHSDFRIAFYNRSFLEIFSPDYPVNEKSFFTDVVRSVPLSELVRNVFFTRKTQKKIMEIATPYVRRTHEVEAVQIPLKNETLVALVFYDLTEIKESEKMKRDFITNASHQLKTPLTAIQGYAETLIDDPKMDLGIRQEFLSKIKSKSIEVSDLVVKLLKLSKLESNAEKIQPALLDVVKTIQDLEKKFEGNLKKHQIQLIHEFQSEEISLLTDVALFQLVLDNLLENAIKYSKQGGKVFIKVVEVDGNIQLSIRDEGIGIPKQDQSRIFERFFRSSNAENHAHDGIGIGMALVKSALERMEGSIQIISDQNEGTEIVLSFPKKVKVGNEG